jgi:hypothetical protein
MPYKQASVSPASPVGGEKITQCEKTLCFKAQHKTFSADLYASYGSG